MKKINGINVLLLYVFITIIYNNARAQAKPNNVTQGTYRTIYEMLRDVPGLDVKTTNNKSGGSVIVRGTGSFNNQKPPLIVVDGTIYGGDITNINPQDVDGISVLKDAASAAAYGVQGAAGVLLITTKKGTAEVNTAVITNHAESAYTYFIEHKTKLKVIGLNDDIIVEGIIQKQQDSSLVFVKKKRELLVPVKNIKKVEMILPD